MGDAGLHRTGAIIGWKTYRRATSGNAAGVAGSGTSTRRGQRKRRCQRPPLEPPSTSHSNGFTAKLSGEHPGLGRALLSQDSALVHPCHQVDSSQVFHPFRPGANRAAPTEWTLFPYLLPLRSFSRHPGQSALTRETLIESCNMPSDVVAGSLLLRSPGRVHMARHPS
jgi:hypothetical protein